VLWEKKDAAFPGLHGQVLFARLFSFQMQALCGHVVFASLHGYSIVKLE
jgi:hypothetical protein